MPLPDLQAALQHHEAGRLDQAEAAYLDVLRAEPNNASALHLLGLLVHQMGRSDEALDLLRRSIQFSTFAPHFHSNLAGVLGKLGRPHEALEHVHAAIRLDPKFPQAHNNLGVVLAALGREEEAVAAHREAIRLNPTYAEALNNLGSALRKVGMLSESVAAHRRAIAVRPDFADAYAGLASTFGETGQVAEAIGAYRRARAIRPDAAALHSDLLFTLHYDPASTPQLLFDEHIAWAQRHARPFYPDAPPPRRDTRGRRLRVGYMSAHFRGHPVTRFFEPVLKHHDRGEFDVFCYSDVVDPDSATARLKSYGHVWRDVQGIPDGRLADIIREDQIDVLVDLTGHMAGHRLLVLARKPAPVQVTYLGYPNTTGLRTMDYRITDSRHDPPGTTERFHIETLYRLDPCCWCYLPDEGGNPIQEPPSSVTGSVTFAALNKLIKVTPTMIRTWSRILEALPGSLLMILAPASAAAEPSIRELFESNGIAFDRLVPVGRMSRERYLQQYQGADVALDTFPYNGHTTTCDALWMGVPVVTLAGDTHVSRAGLDVLTTVGLEELVTRTPDQYVQVAIDLARDVGRIRELRQTMRERMRTSPLSDASGFTKRLEEAYRRM